MEVVEKKDERLICRDCGEKFTFTIGEQRFFAARGFSPPARCPACRSKRQKSSKAGKIRRIPAICVRCGARAYVDYVPRWDKPAYCRECQRVVSAINKQLMLTS